MFSESIFGEFQYFIRRIKSVRQGGELESGQTQEDLEERFRKQVERGLVISDPDAQETAMEVLLSDLVESKKRDLLITLRRTGKCDFVNISKERPVRSSNYNTSNGMENALDLIVKALGIAGITVRRQPLGVKMLQAAHALGGVDYNDHGDLKLLFVETIKYSGHVKKTDPVKLATIFNKLLA